MNDTPHHQFIEVIENGLLHLYCTLSATTGFTPREKRNHILAKWLKPKLKDPAYKPIKGELKRMVMVTKRKTGNLEFKLLELHRMAIRYEQDLNDAKRLFDLLNILHEQHGINSRLFDEERESEDESSNIVYVLPDHIEYCFGENGQQIAPISLFIRGSRYTELAGLINHTDLFFAEVKEISEEANQAHILLHPIKQ